MAAPKWIVNSAESSYKQNKTAIAPVKKLAEEMQRRFEATCEAVNTRKAPTLLMLAGDRVRDLITAAHDMTGINVVNTTSVPEFLVEIGKNNLVGIVVSLDEVSDPASLHDTLRKRPAPVFPVFQRAGDTPNRWLDTFKHVFWAPLESHKIVPLVKDRISALPS